MLTRLASLDGLHVEHTNLELEETSLRWWRCDPARVLDNQLFAVTVGTFLVAIYQITGHEESRTRPDEEGLRHRFAGQLLARVSPGTVSTRCEPIPGRLRPLVDRIIHSRITVSSGGPIGHLEAVATR